MTVALILDVSRSAPACSSPRLEEEDSRQHDLHLLLPLPALGVLELDREALRALPAVRARREARGHERDAAEEARVLVRRRLRAVGGDGGRRVRHVHVQRERARFEGGGRGRLKGEVERVVLAPRRRGVDES
jgi:hypothetical protein